jgi:hypothetical protein
VAPYLLRPHLLHQSRPQPRLASGPTLCSAQIFEVCRRPLVFAASPLLLSDRSPAWPKLPYRSPIHPPAEALRRPVRSPSGPKSCHAGRRQDSGRSPATVRSGVRVRHDLACAPYLARAPRPSRLPTCAGPRRSAAGSCLAPGRASRAAVFPLRAPHRSRLRHRSAPEDAAARDPPCSRASSAGPPPCRAGELAKQKKGEPPALTPIPGRCRRLPPRVSSCTCSPPSSLPIPSINRAPSLPSRRNRRPPEPAGAPVRMTRGRR